MYLKLFESVKITKGYLRSIIFDNNSGFFSFIPNTLYDLLENNEQNYSLLKKELNDESNKTLQQYIDFLLSKKLGVMIQSKKELERLKTTTSKMDTPNDLNYLIIDLSGFDTICETLIQQIMETKIKFIQIRLTREFIYPEILELLSLLRLFNKTYINEISLVLKYDDRILDFIMNGNVDSEKYLQFIMHSSDENNLNTYGSVQIIKTQKKIRIPMSCGVVKLENMNVSRSFYLESLHCNSCLHKKISIDIDGNIRNCPSMSQSFGNIEETTLRQAFQHKDFKKYWGVTKDNVEVCKDCEFRYVCTDCRAYTERSHIDEKGLDVSKPLKCGYSPYTNEWSDWSKNPLKQKGIEFYQMKELIAQ